MLKKNRKYIFEKLLIAITTIAVGISIGLLVYSQFMPADSLSGRWVVVALYLIIAVSNCSLIRKVTEIKQSEQYSRTAIVMIAILLLSFTFRSISGYIGIMGSFYYVHIVARLTENFLPSVFASASLLVVIIMLLFKVKKNLLPVILMLVSAVACICKLAIRLTNPFLPYTVFLNSAWIVSRIVADTMLFVELAVLLYPNHCKDIK